MIIKFECVKYTSDKCQFELFVLLNILGLSKI